MISQVKILKSTSLFFYRLTSGESLKWTVIQLSEKKTSKIWSQNTTFLIEYCNHNWSGYN
jgi:hypothetical protein